MDEVENVQLRKTEKSIFACHLAEISHRIIPCDDERMRENMTNRYFNLTALTKSFLRVTAGPMIKNLWLGTVSGLEHIPKGPAVFVVNHSSYMNFLVIGTGCELLANRPVHFWANQRITSIRSVLIRTEN